MALYTVIKATVDDDINTNGIQAITGAIHNDVLNDLIDAVGAAQVYINPAVTDNPGTPQNPRAYIALPGTYTNFGGLAVTAPLGVLSWNGTAWSVTQLAIPSAYDYFQCKLSAALSAGTPYTTASVTMQNGGLEAKAGQWVQIINRRTGKYDFVQLTVDLENDATTITFKSRVIQHAMAVDSIVEIDPQVNMAWYGVRVGANGIDNYITVPSDWLLPPIQTVDNYTWTKLIDVRVNGKECYWKAVPTNQFEFKLDVSFPLRIYFGEVIEALDVVTVRYLQPRRLTITA